MNFKLLTFIFVVVGVQSINSSIINKQSIDDLVQISNLDQKILDGDPWAKIKSMEFNIENTVVMNDVKYSEVICNNKLIHVENDFCTRGNGKYQARIVKCRNVAYGDGALMRCELFNAKVLNKNVQYWNAYRLYCLPGFNQENYKGMCRFEYSYTTSITDKYDEADDVENKHQI